VMVFLIVQVDIAVDPLDGTTLVSQVPLGTQLSQEAISCLSAHPSSISYQVSWLCLDLVSNTDCFCVRRSSAASQHTRTVNRHPLPLQHLH